MNRGIFKNVRNMYRPVLKLRSNCVPAYQFVPSQCTWLLPQMIVVGFSLQFSLQSKDNCFPYIGKSKHRTRCSGILGWAKWNQPQAGSVKTRFSLHDSYCFTGFDEVWAMCISQATIWLQEGAWTSVSISSSLPSAVLIFSLRGTPGLIHFFLWHS